MTGNEIESKQRLEPTYMQEDTPNTISSIPYINC